MGWLVDLLDFCFCVCADYESGDIAQDLLAVVMIVQAIFMMDVVTVDLFYFQVYIWAAFGKILL